MKRRIAAVTAYLLVLFATMAGSAPAATISGTSITDRLSNDKTAAEVVTEPSGTGLIKIAVMKNMAAEGVTYKTIPASQSSFTPPAGYPVVDMQAATSSGAAIGDWASKAGSRIQTTPGGTKEPPKEEAVTSITDRLSSDKTAAEAVTLPPNTALIKIAVMKNMAGEGVSYKTVPASQRVFIPPAGSPVVDMQAANSAGVAIGDWASKAGSRIQTTPAGEPPKEEPPVEKEPPVEPPPTGSLALAVDSGGWIGESIAADLGGAVKYIRSNARTYNTDAHMGYLVKAGVHVIPLFEDSGDGSLESSSTIANEVVTWFKRYGHGGTYWAGKTDLGPVSVEIVNEPGNPYFWGGNARTNQSQYAGIIEATASALQNGLPAAQPQPKLLVSMDGGFEGDNYGKQLVKVDPNILKLNVGWTVHPYGGKSDRTQSALGGRVRVTESFRPVYVTEVGWPTAVGQPSTGDSFQWTQSEQAENIKTFVKWARGLGYVNDVTIFNYRDYGTNAFYGIESSSGTKKPSYFTLAALTAEG